MRARSPVSCAGGPGPASLLPLLCSCRVPARQEAQQLLQRRDCRCAGRAACRCYCVRSCPRIAKPFAPDCFSMCRHALGRPGRCLGCTCAGSVMACWCCITVRDWARVDAVCSRSPLQLYVDARSCQGLYERISTRTCRWCPWQVAARAALPRTSAVPVFGPCRCCLSFGAGGAPPAHAHMRSSSSSSFDGEQPGHPGEHPSISNHPYVPSLPPCA